MLKSLIKSVIDWTNLLIWIKEKPQQDEKQNNAALRWHNYIQNTKEKLIKSI